MNINDALKSVKGQGLDKANGGADKKTSKASTTESAAKSGDNVTLSPLAEKVKALESKVASQHVFDADKVESIKAAIASGEFKVDTEKVADGLMQTVKDLIHRN